MNTVYFGTISVGGTAVGLNSAYISPGGSPPSEVALIFVESGAIRFRAEKLGTPTASEGGGYELFKGASVMISGNQDMRNFLAIRRENEDINAILLVSYMR